MATQIAECIGGVGVTGHSGDVKWSPARPPAILSATQKQPLHFSVVFVFYITFVAGNSDVTHEKDDYSWGKMAIAWTV